MTQSNSKTPLVFRIGLALLCAMILSTHLMGNLYARYSTTAVGSDSARVAKFDVTATWVKDDSSDTSDAYKLTVTNNSEVAVTYDVVATADGSDLPAGVSITKITNQTLAPNATETHTIQIIEEYEAVHEELLIDIVVKVEQVD